jgi:hypothetical protein
MNVSCHDLDDADILRLARSYERVSKDPTTTPPMARWCVRVAEGLLGELHGRREAWSAFVRSVDAQEINTAAAPVLAKTLPAPAVD